uniref:Uncharacterized protein n=1 Tax=Anopheles maculatus TaxID=74869 RepID=A0A182T1M8_9DIPT
MDENEVMAAFLWSKQSQEMYSNQGLKDLHHLHQDFIINDYTDKIATNIDLLDTELKFAWAALNLLNEEYTKMSEKVFKLQSLNISQQRIQQQQQQQQQHEQHQQQLQHQQVQLQFDNDFLILQRNLANVPDGQGLLKQQLEHGLDPYAAPPAVEAAAVAAAAAVVLPSRSGPPAPELPRMSTNPFLSAGEADRGLLRNIEPADSAAIIEEQLRTSFLNHAKQIELEFGTPKSKKYTAERIEKMQSEEVRELINKIMSEEDVASLSSEEMDKVRCFMAKNCSELMDVFDEDLQVVYPVKSAELLMARSKQTVAVTTAAGASPRKELTKYLPEGIATLTKDDLLTVENGTITIQDS